MPSGARVGMHQLPSLPPELTSLGMRLRFIHKPCEGSNCRPLSARFADRPTDRRCEPSWLSSGGRTADGPNPLCESACRASYVRSRSLQEHQRQIRTPCRRRSDFAFCQLATSLLRPTDLFGRIGGEEFASLLPNIERQDALVLAERLRAAFEATRHTVAAQPFTATVSVGVAISDDASFDLSALLTAADQALYRAKALGRNRVELSTLSPQSPSARQASSQAAA